MKKLSLKLKITLWYAAVMAIISAIAFTAMTTMSRRVLARDIENRLTRTVMDFSRREFVPGTQIDRIPNFRFYSQGVHIEIYDENLNPVGGHIPFEISDLGFSDGKFFSSSSGEKCYVYTKKVQVPDGTVYWLRGAIAVTDESFALESAAKTNLVLMAILIIIAASGGYLILKKALAPVDKIRRTAEQISQSSDLSQRINIGGGDDEIRSLANTFDEMLARIEKTVEREKQFTSDASHELRTPLAVIMSECEYMTDCAKDYGEMKESAVSVKNQAQRMSKLITELLTISRMDKSTVKINLETVDMSELLNFVCDEQEEIRPGCSIKLFRNIEDEILVSADPSLLARLCINLISNAYTYGKDGGKITVSLSQTEKSAVLTVEDDGIGIAPENIDRIWERFFRADPSRTSTDNGNTGLGLSMVKWIADRFGGSVSVESTLGVGSRFVFEMPKSQNISS